MLHRSRLRFSDEALVFHMVTMACYGHAEKIWNNAYPHQNYHDHHQTSLSALFTKYHILSFRKIFLNTKKSGCSESDSDCSFLRNCCSFWSRHFQLGPPSDVSNPLASSHGEVLPDVLRPVRSPIRPIPKKNHAKKSVQFHQPSGGFMVSSWWWLVESHLEHVWQLKSMTSLEWQDRKARQHPHLHGLMTLNDVWCKCGWLVVSKENRMIFAKVTWFQMGWHMLKPPIKIFSVAQVAPFAHQKSMPFSSLKSAVLRLSSKQKDVEHLP